MPYCNSLLLLRLVTVFFVILLTKKFLILLYRSSFSWSQTFSLESSSENGMELGWDEVDLFAPPALNNTLFEALRLNELLARRQIKCENEILVGEDPSFYFCNETRYFSKGKKLGEALVISGSPFGDESFISSLNPSRWTMFIVQGFKPLEELGDTSSYVICWI